MPVSMIGNAIRDCIARGGVILDPFGGDGSLLIASERTGRRARVIELDPVFVDMSIERWQQLTGGVALHADTGQPFKQPAKTAIEQGPHRPTSAG
jgi:DNA modification methylase